MSTKESTWHGGGGGWQSLQRLVPTVPFLMENDGDLAPFVYHTISMKDHRRETVNEVVYKKQTFHK